MSLTTDQHDGCLHELGADGMQKCYLVLPDGERRDLVRPIRRTYRHVGVQPTHPLRDLTEEEHERYDQFGYLKFEKYPGDGSVTGKFWTDKSLNSGCGTETTMAQALAETYAAQPGFYGATYCAGCKGHYPVGPDGEFVWLDGTKVGS